MNQGKPTYSIASTLGAALAMFLLAGIVAILAAKLWEGWFFLLEDSKKIPRFSRAGGSEFLAVLLPISVSLVALLLAGAGVLTLILGQKERVNERRRRASANNDWQHRPYPKR